MRARLLTQGLGVTLLAFTLAACGGDGAAPDTAGTAAETAEAASEAVMLDNGMTVAEQIVMRQERYEALGDTFRTLNQQIRSGSPDLAVLQEAAQRVPTLGEGMVDWFPAGTGPESGIETEALPTIWETPEDFALKVAEFQEAAAALAEAGMGDDIDAIAAAVRATGPTCGGCHDVYRVDD